MPPTVTMYQDFPARFLEERRLTLLARRASGRYPEWFREWVDAEQQATALRTWQPILVPGLLQTRDYARALYQAWQPAASSDDLDALVGARIERQAILDRAVPPELLAVDLTADVKQ